MSQLRAQILSERNRARARNIEGMRSWALVAIAPTEKYRGSARLWHCRCDCGADSFQPAFLIVHKKIKSCGCMTNSIIRAHRTVHGETDSPTWKSWKSMIDRCYERWHKSFKDYGGRGIGVCESWRKSYVSFRADMGQRPDGKSIGRIDNEQGYFAENCRWETAKEQARNRRDSRILYFDGKSMCVAAWADELGIPRTALGKRLEDGWSTKDALMRRLKPDRRRQSILGQVA